LFPKKIDGIGADIASCQRRCSGLIANPKPTMLEIERSLPPDLVD
jgi:hypothetical protein